MSEKPWQAKSYHLVNQPIDYRQLTGQRLGRIGIQLLTTLDMLVAYLYVYIYAGPEP
jgi:hypothetical protein